MYFPVSSFHNTDIEKIGEEKLLVLGSKFYLEKNTTGNLETFNFKHFNRLVILHKLLQCTQREIDKEQSVFLFMSCQDLDSFLTWLVQTQTAAASDQLPNDLEEAERLINKHAALKEEIGRWVTKGQQKANLVFNVVLSLTYLP